jgi:hypothetical protein
VLVISKKCAGLINKYKKIEVFGMASKDRSISDPLVGFIFILYEQ